MFYQEVVTGMRFVSYTQKRVSSYGEAMSTSSMKSKKKVEVSLMGQRFTVRTEKDEAYINQLVDELNTQIEDMRLGSRSASTQHLALLIALNLSDELAQRKAELHELKTQIRKRAELALAEVDSALLTLPLDWKPAHEPQQD